MSTQDTQKLIETAKQMEARGQIEPALEAYKRAGAVEEAARVLLNTKREDEAGGLLLQSLRLMVVQGKVDQRAVDALQPEGKRRLLKAAICFSRGKNTELALDIMVLLGEVPRAVEFLTKMGDPVRAQQLQADFRKKGSGAQFAVSAAPVTASRALGVMNPLISMEITTRSKRPAPALPRQFGRSYILVGHPPQPKRLPHATWMFIWHGEKPPTW
jgi:hypothetical protein